jgi:hypothetical protein
MDRANQLLKDADLRQTKALGNGAVNVVTNSIDLGAVGNRGARMGDFEILISAPAVGNLTDAATVKYQVECDTISNMGSPTVLAKEVIVQTGAGGAGATAATARFRIPSDCQRYVAVRATNSAADDLSDKTLTVELVF